MPLLNREQFLELAEVPRKTAVVPTSRGDVIVRSLTASELALHEASFYDKEGKKIPKHLVTMRERWVVASVVDENGNKLLTLDDLPKIGKFPSADVDAIVDKARELSTNAQRPVEDLAGNSVTPQTSGSGFASRSPSGDPTGGGF